MVYPYRNFAKKACPLRPPPPGILTEILATPFPLILTMSNDLITPIQIMIARNTLFTFTVSCDDNI